MRLLEPVGHVERIEKLLRAAAGKRLAHALLFTGPEGIGKFLAAEWLAFGLLCARGPARPCGTCGPCKRLLAGTHADVLIVDPEAEGEEEIKISRITYREKDPQPNVGDFLALKPMEGGWRVVILRDAGRMNEEAQNALLKTLEEPGTDTLLVLVASRPEALLPTTRSRCVPVVLHPLDRATAAGILRGQGIEAEEAAVLARWSSGAPGAALGLHARSAAAMRTAIEEVLRGDLDPLAAAARIGELEGEFPGRTPASQARARAKTFLDLVLAVLADLERAGAGLAAEALAHGDLAARVAAAGDARRRARLEVCLQARQDVEANLLPDAILERALLALEPGRHPSPAVP
ncbi:MAG: DNA polymerase III subunit delta' [Planctomycetota bacterium]